MLLSEKKQSPIVTTDQKDLTDQYQATHADVLNHTREVMKKLNTCWTNPHSSNELKPHDVQN